MGYGEPSSLTIGFAVICSVARGPPSQVASTVKKETFSGSWGVEMSTVVLGFVMGESFMLHYPLKDGVREVGCAQCRVHAATRKLVGRCDVNGVGFPSSWVW